jgi:hypothetical protein
LIPTSFGWIPFAQLTSASRRQTRCRGSLRPLSAQNPAKMRPKLTKQFKQAWNVNAQCLKCGLKRLRNYKISPKLT